MKTRNDNVKRSWKNYETDFDDKIKGQIDFLMEKILTKRKTVFYVKKEDEQQKERHFLKIIDGEKSFLISLPKALRVLETLWNNDILAGESTNDRIFLKMWNNEITTIPLERIEVLLDKKDEIIRLVNILNKKGVL